MGGLYSHHTQSGSHSFHRHFHDQRKHNMERNLLMKKSLLIIPFIALWLGLFAFIGTAPQPQPVMPPAPVQPAPVQPPEPQPDDPELVGVQVPIPKEMRVYNKTGIQCAWTVMESLAKYHKIQPLMDITKTMKNNTSMGELHSVLREKGVKYTSTQKRYDWQFLEEYVTRRKLGCGIGVHNNAHMVCMVHFEKDKLVKIFDNQGPQALKIQTWQWDEFLRRFSNDSIALIPNEKDEGAFQPPRPAVACKRTVTYLPTFRPPRKPSPLLVRSFLPCLRIAVACSAGQ